MDWFKRNYISLVAVFISIVSTVLLLVRWEPFTIDPVGFFGWTTSALSVISMVLIIFVGGQYFIGKKIIKKEVDKAKGEMKKYSDLLLQNYYNVNRFTEFQKIAQDFKEKGDYIKALINDLRAYGFLDEIKYTGDNGFFTIRMYKYREYAKTVEFMVDKGFNHFEKEDVDSIRKNMRWMYKSSTHQRNEDIRQDVYSIGRLIEKMETVISG